MWHGDGREAAVVVERALRARHVLPAEQPVRVQRVAQVGGHRLVRRRHAPDQREQRQRGDPGAADQAGLDQRAPRDPSLGPRLALVRCRVLSGGEGRLLRSRPGRPGLRAPRPATLARRRLSRLPRPTGGVSGLVRAVRAVSGLAGAHLPRRPTRRGRTIRRVLPAGRRRCARRFRGSCRGPVRLRAPVWLSVPVCLASPVWLGNPVCPSSPVRLVTFVCLGSPVCPNSPVCLDSPFCLSSPVRLGSPVWLGGVGGLVRNGLSVVLDLARRRPSARVGNASHHAYPRRTERPVSIWCHILTATAARARFPGDRPCAPVMNGGGECTL